MSLSAPVNSPPRLNQSPIPEAEKGQNPVSPRTFATVSEFLKVNSGFSLGPDKSYLIRTRLTRVAEQFKLGSVDVLAERLLTGRDDLLAVAVIEAMTTNETLFFRDGRPFDILREQILPLYANPGDGKSVRILSAAASTGQEAYSIAITALEQSALAKGRRFEIVGTDIDGTVLKRAAEAVYSQFEVQRGIPSRILLKYFTQEAPAGWRINPDIRRMVTFRKFNLLDDSMSLGQFDIIFCRNVLIYFDTATKAKVLGNLAQICRKDGFLILGSSETALGLSERWKPFTDVRSIFRRAALH